MAGSSDVEYRKGKHAPSPEIARLLETNDPPSASQEEEFRRIRVDGVKRLAELETMIEELQQTREGVVAERDAVTWKMEYYRLALNPVRRLHLAELETTIEELQQALEGAVAERDALTWKVEHHRLVLNPVRRLPTNVLREIFLFACARSAYGACPPRFYLIRPTLLARVCRSWNDITVMFPQLWRQCRVSVPALSRDWQRIHMSWGNEEKKDDIQVDTATAISRAASCPLWIDLHLESRFLATTPSYILLLSIASRIQRICIWTSDLQICDWPEFRVFTRRLTSLESMDLRITSFDRAQGIPTFSAPHTLRHLIITPYGLLSNPGVNLNWSHLESLVLRAKYFMSEWEWIHSTLVILAKVRNLRRLTFSNDLELVTVENELRTSNKLVQELVTFHHLTDLVIEHEYNLRDVMANISTPSLERLVLRYCSGKGFPWVEGMLQKSRCTLLRVTLQYLEDTPLYKLFPSIDPANSLIRIRQCGLLRELSLLDIRAGTESITQFLSSLESLRQLRVLAIDVSYVRDFCVATQVTVADGILAFLESRRRHDAAGAASHVDLETFTLHAPVKEIFDFTEGQYQRIKALRASGLSFYMCRYYSTSSRRLY